MSLYCFPNRDTIREYLYTHACLNTSYLREKGITEIVADLAAERFSDSKKNEMGLTLGVTLLIGDLQTGKDGFTGKSFAHIANLGLPDMIWKQISMSLHNCLIKLAQKSS